MVHQKKPLLIIAGFLAIVVLAVLFKNPEPAAQTAVPALNWGLSFQTQGATLQKKSPGVAGDFLRVTALWAGAAFFFIKPPRYRVPLFFAKYQNIKG